MCIPMTIHVYDTEKAILSMTDTTVLAIYLPLVD
jgi:hypothetical protein